MSFTIEQQEFISDAIKDAIEKERGRIADVIESCDSFRESAVKSEIVYKIRSGWTIDSPPDSRDPW